MNLPFVVAWASSARWDNPRESLADNPKGKPICLVSNAQDVHARPHRDLLVGAVFIDMNLILSMI
jgi:hypothetical protein